MPKSKSTATSNYESGIRRIGISAWEQASRETTPAGAASVLEDAKADSLTVGDFVDAYERAYE